MNQNTTYHALFPIGWIALGLGLVLLIGNTFVPDSIYTQPDRWLPLITEWSNTQLNRLRNLEQITQLWSFAGRVILVWLLAAFLLPFAAFAIAPGQLQTLRLGLVLTTVFAPQYLLTFSYMWLNQYVSDFSYLLAPVLQTTSIMAIWLTITNQDHKARQIVATRARVIQLVREYVLVQIPDMVKKLPLGMAVAAIIVSRNEAYLQVQDLLLLLVFLICQRLSSPISKLTLATFSANNHIAVTLLRSVVACIWLVPVVAGFIWLAGTEQLFSIKENYVWLLLLLPAGIIGIPLGVGYPPPRTIIWLTLFALLALTAGIHADTTSFYHQLTSAFSPSASALIIWILQIALVALMASFGWRSFSNNQRHAVSLVQTGQFVLWLLMLRKPLLNACTCGLLLAAWASTHSILITFVLSLALAGGFACLLLQTGSVNKNL